MPCRFSTSPTSSYHKKRLRTPSPNLIPKSFLD